jgi:hypothetical protein
MFKKKNKKQNETEAIEKSKTPEVIEVTSKDISEAINKSDIAKKVKQDKPSKFFNFNKEEDEEVKQKDEIREENLIVEHKEEFTWATSPEYEEKLAKENKKKKRRKKIKTEESKITEEIGKTEEKKELNTYFEADKEKSKKLNRKERKNKSSDNSDKISKRKSRKEKLQEDIKNQKLFRYNNKKYTKVEDFITYLNEHYLDIEKISEEVLDDENFFGWINKNSGMFNQSLKEYKEIKVKIENKS